MENIHLIGTRARDLLAYSIVPQPATLPLARHPINTSAIASRHLRTPWTATVTTTPLKPCHLQLTWTYGPPMLSCEGWTDGSHIVTGPDYVRGGPTCSSSWSVSCPEQFRQHTDTPNEHARMLCFDSSMKHTQHAFSCEFQLVDNP
jgi:hypothetical protein